MMPNQRALLFGLGALVVMAPLRFGAVEPWAASLLVALTLAAGIVWVVGRTRRGLSTLPWRDPILIAGTALALFGALQTVPLPRRVLERVAPKAIEMRDLYEPRAPGTADASRTGAAQVGEGEARPISLHPWATRQAALRILAWTFALLIAVDLAAHRSGRRALASALVAAGAFQAVYGLGEFFSGRQQIFGYAKKDYTDVATGTFINRNHFAGCLEMTLPLALALAAIALSRLPGKRSGSMGERLAGAPGRLLFAAGALLVLSLTMATAIICSRSRMGIASLLLALLSTGLVMLWRGRGRAFPIAAVTVVVATLLIFGQADALSPITERFANAMSEFRGGMGRWEIWSQSAAMARAFPILGVGLGVFPQIFPVFRTAGAGVALDHAHNDFLELAAEVGIVGLLLAAAGAAAIALPLLRRARATVDPDPVGYAGVVALVSIAYHSITDFNLAIPANALTLSVVAGMVVAWLRGATPVLAIDHAAPRSSPARALLPACLLAGLAGLAMSPVVAEAVPERIASRLDGDDAARLSRAAARIGRGALSDLEVLARAQADGAPASPQAASYIEGRLAEAIRVQEAGLRRFPASSSGHLEVAQLRLGACAGAALAGRPGVDCASQAMPELRAALALDPMSASLHAEVARLLAVSWDLLDETERVESRAILARAARMNPGDRELQGMNLTTGEP
jgi:O-antigen ligase